MHYDEIYFQNEPMYYNREFMMKLHINGFHLVNDLISLYHMTNYLKKYAHLSPSAKKRLKWFDYYRKTKNAALTCRYFSISRKTFYKWKKEYNPLNLYSLEDKSKTPKNVRQPEIAFFQEQRIIQLRKDKIQYGKIKLAKIYQETYGEKISSWKIQRIIQKYQLYALPKRVAGINKKRLKAFKKRRIVLLKKKPKKGFLLCMDTVHFSLNNLKRYVFTAIDHYSKLAFARMYKSANSLNAQDFLNRLLFLVEGKIENLQTDNGSEFQKCFEKACLKMNLNRYYNRPRTPKDNSVNERFNRTLREEFVDLGNYSSDTLSFNRDLTEWLIEYNFKRPHTSLNYETPVGFSNSNSKVLPMWSSDTSS
jgi:transposase InsO family protein